MTPYLMLSLMVVLLLLLNVLIKVFAGRSWMRQLRLLMVRQHNVL
jgi:hypothetical protein